VTFGDMWFTVSLSSASIGASGLGRTPPDFLPGSFGFYSANVGDVAYCACLFSWPDSNPHLRSSTLSRWSLSLPLSCSGLMVGAFSFPLAVSQPE